MTPTYLIAILQHTPLYVWAIFALLFVIGLRRAVPHTMAQRQVVLWPLAMLAYAFYGVASSFGSVAPAYLAWMGGVAVALIATLGLLRVHGRYDVARRQYTLPGSLMPMVVMLALFGLKYVAGVRFAIDPASHGDLSFALLMSAAWGLCSGAFLGRAVRLWIMAWRAPAQVVSA